MFDELRWAAHLFKQALIPDIPAPLITVPSDARATEPESDSGRERVISSYTTKISANQQLHDRAASMRVRCFRYAAACAAVLVAILYLSLGAHWISPWLALLPLAAGAFALVKARQCKRRVQDANCLITLYADRLKRVQHQWVGKGDDGSDLEMPHHLSAADLDLFGEGSLFELLCDAQTPAGRETLARWLQDPATTDEVISRQQSVRYLREHIDLRESLALVRVANASDYSWNMLRDWLTADPIKFPRWAPWLRLFLSLSMVVTGVCWGLGLLPAHGAVWRLVAIAAAEGGLVLWLKERVERVMEGLMLTASKLDSMRRLCAFWEGERLQPDGLKALQRRLRGASRCVAQLQGLVWKREVGRNEYFIYFSLLLMWGTQWAMRIERWRQRRGRELMEWFNVLGEFETLLAIASYAYENPDDPNPEFENNGPLFEATGLGHPLLNPSICVRNNIKLNADKRFLMVTGSNMSGKSTLLRAVGLNATLAWTGAPVRARRLCLSPLQICASIRVEDNLSQGLSHFYAEVQRLRAMLDCATSGPPVLFLIDELFAGTNSADRRVAAEAVIRLLVERQAIGLVTSHDLALTAIAENPGLGGANVHLSDTPTATGLSFDYRLRPGKLDRSNALKIIQMVGIPLGQRQA